MFGLAEIRSETGQVWFVFEIGNEKCIIDLRGNYLRTSTDSLNKNLSDDFDFNS